MLIKLNPKLAKLLISPREKGFNNERLESLETAVQEHRWDNVPPIWLTPNFLFNGFFRGFFYDVKKSPENHIL